MFYVSSSLSGNEVLFSLETASDYVKDEKACFYGFKCVAVGYEFNPGPDEVQTCLHFSLAFFLPEQILFLSEILVLNNSGYCNILLTNPLGAFQGLIMLEKELAYLGSVCAAALMKKDLALPIGMETVEELISLF